MHDLAFVGFLLTLFAFGFRRPFLFVLVYAYIDIVAPQRLTYTLLNTVPISLAAAILAIGSWLATSNMRDSRIAPRQIVMVLLLVYCWLTTQQADFPLLAQEKWAWVWKGLFFASFLPLALTTRLRIESLALCLVFSVSYIIIIGGMKTLGGGGGYGTLSLGAADSGIYESSTISAVAICVIPLILYLRKYNSIFPTGRLANLLTLAIIFAALLLPVGTTARTGLVCIAVLALLSLRSAKRRFTYIFGALTLFAVALPLLPASYVKRMATITTPQSDRSAGTRLAVWQWTWDYAQKNPFGGGFVAYKANKVKIEVVKEQGDDGQTSTESTFSEDKARAYHSAYFEMLGEQGFPGLFLWLTLHIGGLIRMQVLRSRYLKKGADEDRRWIGALAEALQHGQIIYLAGAMFLGIAFQPFILMMLGLQIGLDSYVSRLEFKPMAMKLRRSQLSPA